MDTQARRHGHRKCTSFQRANAKKVAIDGNYMMGASRKQRRKVSLADPHLAASTSKSAISYTALLRGNTKGLTKYVDGREGAKSDDAKKTGERFPQTYASGQLSPFRLLQYALVLLLALADPCKTAFIGFKNCLSPNIINSELLQFTPLLVWASFDSSTSHNLNITVYGNVSGQATQGRLPPPSDPKWHDPKFSMGDIIDVPKNYTTLKGTFDVLNYTPYTIPSTRFCSTTLHRQCPLSPVFENVS